MEHQHHVLTHDKQKALIALKKAQSLIKKIAEMVEDDKYCIDIIQQVDSAAGLLNSTKRNLLEGHLYHCVEQKFSQDKKKTVDELLRIYSIGKK